LVRRMSGGLGDDRPALLFAFLAGVALEGDRALAVGAPGAQELLELAVLAVGQGVHGVDADGLHPRLAPAPEDRVHDRDDVSKALARPCPGGEHVRPVAAGHLYRLDLVAVEPQAPWRLAWLVLAEAEDVAAARVERPLGDQLVHPGALGIGGVEGDPRLGPQQAFAQLLVDDFLGAWVLYRHEAGDERLVVVDHPVSQLEDVHRPRCCSWPAVVPPAALAGELPARLGLPLSRLHVPDIASEVVSRGIVAEISGKTVWRWLSEDAVKPRRHRWWIFPRGPDFEAKAGRVLDLYAREWEGEPLSEDD
jgi:hypothetical protein